MPVVRASRRIQTVRGTKFISIPRPVADGAGLRGGEKIVLVAGRGFVCYALPGAEEALLRRIERVIG
ncbi:MAG: hypothetical protein ACLP8V_05805 [Thermoplasmata archaeon]